MNLPRLSLSLVLLALGVSPFQGWDAVVAIRYLQAAGKSHGTIFLFTGAGKLVRPLSEPGASQDGHPVFSPDGTQVVLVRHSASGGEDKLLIVEAAGGKARPIAGAPPAWYTGRAIGKFFNDEENGKQDSASTPKEKAGTTVYPSADGSVTLILSAHRAEINSAPR